MDKTYWLGRKRAAMAMARGADGSAARLIHYEMAGRYSIKAAQAVAPPPPGAPSVPDPAPLRLAVDLRTLPDEAYYARLAAGAEYMAERAADPAKRDGHLAHARDYRRRERDSAPAPARARAEEGR